MIATLQLETALRDRRTVLQTCFCTPPFKVLDVTEDRRTAALHLMLMNASPGVLDGDVYTMGINVAEGCALELHTQSYQRIFKMKGGAAQHLAVTLKKGSRFCFLPHPTVPHAGANFTAKTNIYLSGGCTLVWGEVLTCGRKGSGEAFRFSTYHSLTQFFLDGRLIVKENLLLQPQAMDVTGIGRLEGFTHQASFICLDETCNVVQTMDRLYNGLLLHQGICFGLSALPARGFIIRLLGHRAEQLHGLLKKLAAQCVSETTLPPRINTALHAH